MAEDAGADWLPVGKFKLRSLEFNYAKNNCEFMSSKVIPLSLVLYNRVHQQVEGPKLIGDVWRGLVMFAK